MKTRKSKQWLKLQASTAQSLTIFEKYMMGM